MKTVETAGGWSWYARMVKESIGRELTPEEVKVVMRMYIGSRTYQQATEEIFK